MARSRARSGALVQAATAPSSRRIDSPGSPEVSLSRARIEARSVRSTVRSCSTASAIASSATLEGLARGAAVHERLGPPGEQPHAQAHRGVVGEQAAGPPR